MFLYIRLFVYIRPFVCAFIVIACRNKYSRRHLPLTLPPVVCRWAHVLFTLCVFECLQWCSTQIALFVLFCLSSSCVPCFASFSGLSFLIAPSVFSNVYLQEPKVVDDYTKFNCWQPYMLFQKRVVCIEIDIYVIAFFNTKKINPPLYIFPFCLIMTCINNWNGQT